MKDAVLTALNLPALEGLGIIGFEHQGGALQPEQLCCPQLCSLSLLVDSSLTWDSEGSRHCCSLLNLPRLTTLSIANSSHLAMGLPVSVTHLTVQDWSADKSADLEWVLLEAAKCMRAGAQLRSLTYVTLMLSSHPEVITWDASSYAHYRELGEQLSSLKDLSVYGNGPTLLGAIGAVACSAPSLTRLKFYTHEPLGVALPPICSASFQSFTGRYLSLGHAEPPQSVVLTFLAGCTQLREVRVQFLDTPTEGTSVKVCCHCNSQRCIVPFEGCAESIDRLPSNWVRVGIRFLPMPASPQGLQAYTVLFTGNAIGPEQAPKWGHVVMAGVQ